MPPYTEQQMTVSFSPARVRVLCAWLYVCAWVPWLWKPIGLPVARGLLRGMRVS